MLIQKIVGVLLLCLLMVGCASVPPAPSGDTVTFNRYQKIEATGIVLPDPTTGRPLFVLGQMGYDEATTPAVYVTGENQTAPLQATYTQRQLPDGTLELIIYDGTSNCGSFDVATNTDVQNTGAGLFKTFGMGMCAQDLGIGLGDAVSQ